MIRSPLFEAITFSSKTHSISTAQRQRAYAGLRKRVGMEREPRCEGLQPGSVEADKHGSTFFHLRVANDRDAREKAYRLAAGNYQQSGYVSAESGAILFMPYDERPDTLTLLAEDQDGQPVGTITLVFDSMAGLPCDGIFSDEVDRLRQGGRRLVEVTRLAIASKYQNSKTVLLRLINSIFIYSVWVRGFSDFVVEVNPRHTGFYTRLLSFESLGSVRPCPRVRSAPAVMLRLDLSVYVREIVARDNPEYQSNARLLFSRFLPLAEEPEVASFLAGQHRPMDAEDALYFKRMGAGRF